MPVRGRAGWVLGDNGSPGAHNPIEEWLVAQRVDVPRPAGSDHDGGCAAVEGRLVCDRVDAQCTTGDDRVLVFCQTPHKVIGSVTSILRCCSCTDNADRLCK